MITQRQLQVLRLWAKGMSHIEIAYELGISLRTVEAHMKGATESLGAKNSVNAVAIAVRDGIIELLFLVSFGQAITVDVPEIFKPGDDVMTSNWLYQGDSKRPPRTRTARLRVKARRSKREKEEDC